MQTQSPKTSSLPSQTQHCLMSLTLSSSPLGDYVGIESCLDLKAANDVVSVTEDLNTRRFVAPRKELATKKIFPPPIPLLARTENLTSHMPWVLKRYYTSDGRLILKEERVRHHEYFRARRCNGRLTLQLIPLDDEVDNYSVKEEEDEEEEGIEEEQEHLDDDEDYVEEEEEDEDIEEVKVCESQVVSECQVKVCESPVKECESPVKVCESQVKACENDDYGVYEDQRSLNNGGIGAKLSPCKLLNYNTIIQSATYIFQMPVPALRPVHT
ncbi:structural constituent of ribosome [Euphorbia peplus]|nr:structural constituent of ribosome [Euphorbia peplus]